MPIVSSHGGGGASVPPAIVERAILSPWNGAALPFDVIRTDPLGLWDATNSQFVADVTGWYDVRLYATAAGGGVYDDGGIGGSVFASVGGPGDNIGAGLSYLVGTNGVLPMLAGITRLRAGDTIDIEGVAVGTFSVGTLAFSVQRIST